MVAIWRRNEEQSGKKKETVFELKNKKNRIENLEKNTEKLSWRCPSIYI